jgi:hypothetical protein
MYAKKNKENAQRITRQQYTSYVWSRSETGIGMRPDLSSFSRIVRMECEKLSTIAHELLFFQLYHYVQETETYMTQTFYHCCRIAQ